jgi:long-chain acyl-CoA synthetase
MTEYVSPRDLVRRGAERHGDRPALIGPDTSMTYRELADRTARAADLLKRAGVGPGVQAAISLPNCAAFPIWHFGVLQAGGIVAALPTTLTPSETADLLTEAGIGFLIAPADSTLPGEIGFELAAAPGFAPGTALWRADGPLYRLATTPWTPRGYLQRQFSSGSTGRPKHLLRSEIGAFHFLRAVCQTTGLRAGDRFLAVASFGQSYGNGGLQTAFHLGGSVALLPRFLPSQVLDLARRTRPTVFLMTPPMVETLANCLLDDGDERAFESLRHCECSTGMLRKAAHDGFRRRYGVSVHPRYSTTESRAAAIDLEDDFEEGRVGRPFAGVTISILDAAGNPCPAGVTGDIAIRSPAASDRYVGDPEMSARTFRDGHVIPGDRGFLDDRGMLHVLGRSDIINIGGSKVDRLEVERVIRNALPITDVVVMEGRRAGLPAIRAVIEGDPARISRAAVIAACRAELSAHKIPALVQVVAKFQRDANGKVLKSFFDDLAPDGAGN